MGYASFTSFVMTHLLMGVTMGIVLYLIGHVRNKPRPWQFGGELLSVGLPSRWILWLLGCISFEILSSCHMPDQYQEIGYSFIEGPIMVAGAFMVDRLCRWHELDEIWEPIAPDVKGVVHDITDRLKQKRESREAGKAQHAASRQEQENETKAQIAKTIKDFEKKTEDY